MVLHRHPRCVTCLEAGRVALSTVADHVVPLDPKNPSEGDWHLKNGQGLCVPCHNAKTAKEKKA
jgi:5-methylcytosine-specific restriction protein A|tara:strand:+ start:5601 stop:5792 length:192 start_codon:yes stop_codon:yes gene_type:complete